MGDHIVTTLALSERKEILESTRNDNFIEMMVVRHRGVAQFG